MGRISTTGGIRDAMRRRRAQRGLDSIQIAKPCSARWEEMAGDDKVRFCSHCKLNVFNLSAMDLEEAARVIAEKDGRLCVRFYRRRDGTTLTKNCPVGVAAWRRRTMLAWSAACGAVGAMAAATFGWNPFASRQTVGDVATSVPAEIETAPMGNMAFPSPPADPPEMGTPIMGGIPAPIQEKVAWHRTDEVQVTVGQRDNKPR